LGISGGFYIVPLYAMMQAYSPRSHRARVVAANKSTAVIINSILISIFKTLKIKIEKIAEETMNTAFKVLVAVFILFPYMP
jgi:hypothetical protein